MSKPEFTREGLERWAARRSDDAGRLFTFCLSLMDELYETRGSALDTHKKYLAVQLERCKDVDALRGAMSIAFAFGPKDARTAKARRLYTHPHMEQARARIAAWDKENHDG